MTKKEKERLIKEAVKARGRRRNRYVNETEINIMAQLDRKRNLAGKTIRVYSRDGFVPNSYKYPAWIDYVSRWYDDEGNKHFEISTTGASRPHGTGALITIDSRACPK